MNNTKRKNTRHIHAINICMICICAALAFWDARRSIQFAALLGVTWLTILLVAPRLMHVSRLQAFKPQLTLVAEQSKYVGLWVCVWFVVHAGFALARHAPPPFAPIFLLQPHILPGALSLTILLVLAALSNNWSYANIKWWKHISMLVWALPFLALAHSLLASNVYMSGQLLFISPILLVLAALSGYSALIMKHRDYFFWWRLFLLTAGGILALIITFWVFSA